MAARSSITTILDMVVPVQGNFDYFQFFLLNFSFKSTFLLKVSTTRIEYLVPTESLVRGMKPLPLSKNFPFVIL